MKDILFTFCIFMSIWWGTVTIAKAVRKQTVYALNFIIMSAAFTGVITHIIGIW